MAGLNELPKLLLDSYSLELLKAIDLAHAEWQNTVNHLHSATDEEWLAELDRMGQLESRFRALQDQLCAYLRPVSVDTRSV